MMATNGLTEDSKHYSWIELRIKNAEDAIQG